MDTLNLEIQANSPYNDGWTQQFYKDELKKVKAKKDEPKIHPKRAEVAEANADALFADGFDDAISEEAHEYMEFNVVGAYVGDFTPIFVHSL